MEELNITEDYIELELQAQQQYIDNVYSRKVPAPKKPNTSFWNLVGIDATLFSLSALFGAILSSVRTGGLFYILEQELLKEYSITTSVTNVLSTVALVASLVAFEGFLLAVGFSVGRRNSNVKISKLGIVLAFLVVISAGVFSGFGIVEIAQDTRNMINIALAIITAISSAFITYFGGENIGYSIALYEKKKSEIEDQFQKDFNSWNESAMKSYSSSKYNILGRNYIGNKLSNLLSKNETEEDTQKPDKKDEISEHETTYKYHYVTDFKNKYTNEEKLKFYQQGVASLKKLFPDMSEVQILRWWKNLERDLQDAGFLDSGDQGEEMEEDWE